MKTQTTRHIDRPKSQIRGAHGVAPLQKARHASEIVGASLRGRPAFNQIHRLFGFDTSEPTRIALEELLHGRVMFTIEDDA